MASGPAVDAFRDEAKQLSAVIMGTDDTALDRPSPCPPWTARELLCQG